MHAGVHTLVVPAGNLECHPAFKLRHGHGGARLAAILAALDGVGERGTGQPVDTTHQGAEVAFDVGAKLGSARRSILEADTVALATPPQGQAVEFLTIVHVNEFWQTRRRPVDVQVPFLEPLVFRQASHRQGQTHRGRRRRIQPQRKTQNDAGGNIKGDCDPGPTHGLAQ